MSRLEHRLAEADSSVRSILERSIEGRRLKTSDAIQLVGARESNLEALCASADWLRAEQAGSTVTYVVNRNINFTNVCVKSCRFCAFARGVRSEEAYFLEPEDVIERTQQAQALGATEVCIQAGLAPIENPRFYIDLITALKQACPDIHIHAYSPEEIVYGAERMGLPLAPYLEQLRDAGLGSLPGTSAEILDDRIRDRIAPGRLSTQAWIEVIRTAHSLGIPTTSTLMFGHVESPEDRVHHMGLLRTIQEETGGFTEFVPLSFVHEAAPLFVDEELSGVRSGPSAAEVRALYATARLMLGASFRNIQASWVKEGPEVARALLRCGVNDLGGTLMNESISTTAGARNGQFMSPATLRSIIRSVDRDPAERSTTYSIIRRFARNAGADGDALEPLDNVSDANSIFGSYAALAADDGHRFRMPDRPARKITPDHDLSSA